MSDFSMYRGDTKKLDIAVSKDNQPTDLTDGKMWMTSKRNWGDALNVFQKSSPSNGIVITDAQNGLATITLSPSDTSDLPPEQVKIVYDVQIREDDGTITTIQTGVITVNPDATEEIT